jgi:serine phosphatase RsbU (regulator of sigma subunit)
VSGDFYWAAQLNVNNNTNMPLVLAAVVDCTGHGVPGAFLSIMANDFLKQSIVDPDVQTPSEILDFLNEKISSHLNQASSKNKMRDGMDIALIGIDKPKRKLYFSGANNPIYIFREVNGVIDQIILTATKQAIGLISEETVKYAIREFNLVKGDIVYLFSDGYADQFGGENNKKLTYKRFRELMVAAFHLPMAEQKSFLEKAFDDWCANTDQIDDVTVMGIRIT